MCRVPIIAAATLIAGVLAAIPASATLSSGPLPLLDGPSTSNVQQVAMMGGHRFMFRNHFGNRFAFRHRFMNRRFVFRHRFRNRAAFAFGVGAAFGGAYGYGYGYGAPVGYDHVQYCMSRYRTYDPATDTFIGYDGLHHRCGASYGGSYSGSYGGGSYGGGSYGGSY
jgi:hypothetical protein